MCAKCDLLYQVACGKEIARESVGRREKRAQKTAVLFLGGVEQQHEVRPSVCLFAVRPSVRLRLVPKPPRGQHRELLRANEGYSASEWGKERKKEKDRNFWQLFWCVSFGGQIHHIVYMYAYVWGDSRVCTCVCVDGNSTLVPTMRYLNGILGRLLQEIDLRGSKKKKKKTMIEICLIQMGRREYWLTSLSIHIHIHVYVSVCIGLWCKIH